MHKWVHALAHQCPMQQTVVPESSAVPKQDSVSLSCLPVGQDTKCWKTWLMYNGFVAFTMTDSGAPQSEEYLKAWYSMLVASLHINCKCNTLFYSNGLPSVWCTSQYTYDAMESTENRTCTSRCHPTNMASSLTRTTGSTLSKGSLACYTLLPAHNWCVAKKAENINVHLVGKCTILSFSCHPLTTVIISVAQCQLHIPCVSL